MEPPVPHPLRVLATISRIHIVAIATLGTLTFGWLFLGERPWLLAGITGLDWFLVNLLNRVVDLREDAANSIPGTDWVARHRRAVLVSGLVLLAASFVGVALVAPEILPFRVAFHALGFAYNWPLLPGARRIKQLYFWKNVASATGFLLTVFGYPLASRHGAAFPAGVTTVTVLLAGAFFFLLELSYEVVYDLRDAPGDRESGVLMYPVVHGERVAARIVDGLLAGSGAILVVGYAAAALPWRLAVMAAAPGLQAVLVKRALGRGITSRDCIRLTWLGTGLLAGYHLWIAAGLPGIAG